VDEAGQGAGVQRYKGLGEMNAEQLWETTLNPETRTLLQVSLEDAATAEHQLRVIMGDNAEARRNWLAGNVKFGLGDDERPAPEPVVDDIAEHEAELEPGFDEDDELDAREEAAL
jgi:hypothetical protein